MFAATSWGYRHPYMVAGIRIAVGTWNLILGSIFIAHGYRWGALFYATATLIFVAAYALARGKFGTRHDQ